MDCGACLARYLLCGFNLVWWVGGAAVLAVGAWLAADTPSFIYVTSLLPAQHVQVTGWVGTVAVRCECSNPNALPPSPPPPPSIHNCARYNSSSVCSLASGTLRDYGCT